MLEALYNLSGRKRRTAQLERKFHTALDGGPCICYSCAPKRWVELPPASEPDPFLDSTEGMLEQTRCLLYSKLPTEIRIMIWEEMFAGYVIVPKQSAIGSRTVCPDVTLPWCDMCECGGKDLWRNVGPVDCPKCRWSHQGARTFCTGCPRIPPYLLAEWRVFRGQHKSLHRTCRRM